jgi:hypothetical protein
MSNGADGRHHLQSATWQADLHAVARRNAYGNRLEFSPSGFWANFLAGDRFDHSAFLQRQKDVLH